MFRRDVEAYNSTLTQYQQKITRIKDEGRTSLSDIQQRQAKERMSLKLSLDWQNAQEPRRAKARDQSPAAERASRQPRHDRQRER